MALLRSDPAAADGVLRLAAPTGLVLGCTGAGFLTGLAVHRSSLRLLAALVWVLAVLIPLLGWGFGLWLRRRRYRRGVRRVGQWVRCARVAGGQIDGLAAVRAGAPISPADTVTGWLSLEHEMLRFRPTPPGEEPDAAWSVAWEQIAVVDVRPASRVRARLLPGLGSSLVSVRFRGHSATLDVQVEQDAASLLRAWQRYGVGERAATRGADR